MNNISIETLFPSSKHKIKNGQLDVNTLFPEDSRLNDDTYFNVDELANERKDKENKLRKVYKTLLRQCITKAKTANSGDYTDIIFDVPKTVYLCPHYNSHKCLLYIEKKMRKLYIDTLIITERHIFISWLNVDRNKEIDRNLEGYYSD